ncbi:hypothetical protein M440DRAFT_1438828 [Trichoderma longibrachiatum ATCC 18648]|uniref:RED-like N-terminal domain-containing protein n=1 Tax=Trichoderma longibrachiatum ATCC 18648 TaxID=983965 RepID=A0A2T4C3F9_TRILO|nr:hypothetical protein M440DRAFT_1438828 [Trichoderma longibrachiatum ATCC 18648]
MNNEQFRKLMLAKSGATSKDDASPKGTSPGASTPNLGSRQRNSIPMTPRSLGGAQADFARQLAERNSALHPAKRFKTSVPKGVKLGTGYVDRAKSRQSEADEREERLKALEKALKDDEIDQATYEKLRFQIAGGDLSSTHLVKGLDFKLLERIRKGEDVYGNKPTTEDGAQEAADAEEDVEDELDRIQEQEVQAVTKEKEKKKGTLATVPVVPGKKRTRDQILAELKAARLAAQQQKESTLGDRFKKIGAKQKPGTRIERDSKGREVLIIVDEDGHEKRKVRKVQPEEEDARKDLLMPDKSAKPLGMEIPEQYRKKEEPQELDGDVDIFEDAGDDYDPLAGIDASDSESDEEEKSSDTKQEASKDVEASDSMPPPPKPSLAQPERRNYFKDSKTGLISEEAGRAPSMSDPAILAAIKKAATLRPIEQDDEDDKGKEEAKALEEKRKKLLQMQSRDDEDIDMGFGTSRFEDEEDFEDKKIKLSKWGDDAGEEGSGRGDKSKRKRGPKKRKGDVNSAADILRVVEQRKKSA